MTDKIGRNKPCPCGSGQKYKYCCNDKKARSTSLVFGGLKEAVSSVAFGPNGEVKLISKDDNEIVPEYCFFQTLYEKNNGSMKVLNQRLSKNQILTTNPHIYTDYNVLFGVDCNTKLIHGIRHSVGVAYACFTEKINETEGVLHYYLWGVAQGEFPENNEEKYVLSELIKKIMKSPSFNQHSKIGIITDHDLLNIPKYNNRELPIFDNFYLPNNFELIYASADTQGDGLYNKLIYYCDKEAKKILNRIK